MVEKKPRIVIVGAGMAGLAAAHTLHHAAAASLFDLCVLEAGGRIGGRILTSEFSGVRVEMGATWIHGIGGSPVYHIADRIGALRSATPWERMDGLPRDAVTVAEGGHPVDPAVVADIASLYRGLMDLARAGSRLPTVPGAGASGTAAELSVGSFLRQGLRAYRASRRREREAVAPPAVPAGSGWSREALEESVFAANENEERNDTSADELTDLDLAAEAEYRAFPGEQITIAQGYTRIVEHLASALPQGVIRLGKKVEKIEWAADAEARVHLEDGTVVAADHVIVTVSLGVLKAAVRKAAAGSGLFSPGLPPFKREAIARLGFGVVDKLFVEHEGPFPFLQLAFEQEPLSPRRVEKIPRWIRRTPSICPVYGGSQVLLAWFVGKEAMEMESLDAEEVIRGVQATMEGFSTGTAGRRNRNGAGELCGCGVKRVWRSAWGADPLFLGSYSYVAVGSSGEDLDAMAEPLGGPGRPLQILFAGEATHRTHYSTTHGAYFSGVREARRLLRHYQHQYQQYHHRPPSSPPPPPSPPSS